MPNKIKQVKKTLLWESTYILGNSHQIQTLWPGWGSSGHSRKMGVVYRQRVSNDAWWKSSGIYCTTCEYCTPKMINMINFVGFHHKRHTNNASFTLLSWQNFSRILLDIRHLSDLCPMYCIKLNEAQWSFSNVFVRKTKALEPSFFWNPGVRTAV